MNTQESVKIVLAELDFQKKMFGGNFERVCEDHAIYARTLLRDGYIIYHSHEGVYTLTEKGRNVLR